MKQCKKIIRIIYLIIYVENLKKKRKEKNP